MSTPLDFGSVIDEATASYASEVQTRSIKDFVKEYYPNLLRAQQSRVPWEHLAEAVSTQLGETNPKLKTVSPNTLKQYFYERKQFLAERSSRRKNHKLPVSPPAPAPEAKPLSMADLRRGGSGNLSPSTIDAEILPS